MTFIHHISESERKYILKYYKTLYKLSQEFIIDEMGERIRAEVLMQSQIIQTVDHAFDLLETADLVQSKDARRNCREYLRNHLTSLEKLKKGFEKRNISLESRMNLKGVLFKNLGKQIQQENNGDEFIRNMKDIFTMAREMESFELERELREENDEAEDYEYDGNNRKEE